MIHKCCDININLNVLVCCRRCVEQSDLDGNHRQVVLESLVAPVSLEVFAHHVYWVDHLGCMSSVIVLCNNHRSLFLLVDVRRPSTLESKRYVPEKYTLSTYGGIFAGDFGVLLRKSITS